MLGMTITELGERMPAWEFFAWLAYLGGIEDDANNSAADKIAGMMNGQ